MMKMQCVTVDSNIYERVSDYMKIHHDRFWTFKDTLRTKQLEDSSGLIKQNENGFQEISK